ncbi:MAG: SWF/SNF helicase family protein [Verrucomicrobia bacterium]|nr:SWF/SNF helicase family protein [Verrucomicrobiota bacterium]
MSAAGHKAVVFSQFTSLLDRVASALKTAWPTVPLFTLTGSTVDRKTPVAAFQKHSGTAIMLASLKAGGTGITLNQATTVFLLDPWWNPAAEQQAMDRVHRMGQKQRVSVYRLIAKGTIEERIEALKTDKRDLFASLFDNPNADFDWSSSFKDIEDLLGPAAD